MHRAGALLELVKELVEPDHPEEAEQSDVTAGEGVAALAVLVGEAISSLRHATRASPPGGESRCSSEAGWSFGWRRTERAARRAVPIGAPSV
jgi:hypothetical protein